LSSLSSSSCNSMSLAVTAVFRAAARLHTAACFPHGIAPSAPHVCHSLSPRRLTRTAPPAHDTSTGSSAGAASATSQQQQTARTNRAPSERRSIVTTDRRVTCARRLVCKTEKKQRRRELKKSHFTAANHRDNTSSDKFFLHGGAVPVGGKCQDSDTCGLRRSVRLIRIAPASAPLKDVKRHRRSGWRL
ncbi:uncharacterized protein Tco025E_09956, partial [Trypanosoma conorhini]